MNFISRFATFSLGLLAFCEQIKEWLVNFGKNACWSGFRVCNGLQWESIAYKPTYVALSKNGFLTNMNTNYSPTASEASRRKHAPENSGRKTTGTQKKVAG